MNMQSVEGILKQCDKKGLSFWEAVLEYDMQSRHATREESLERMSSVYQAMKEADDLYDASLHSSSGLVGGDGKKILDALEAGLLLSGDFIGKAMSKAVKTAESNACMKRIVAAPTAGSCGVVPAVFLTAQEQLNLPTEKMVEAMYVVAGLGQVIATRAFISGAEGGCQAEVGSASAMAAGGLAYLKGGDSECIAHACAMGMKNLLGLVCDPVAGLVEVPCVKRNVIGAVNAIACADMAVAGVRSAIPVDEVIDAMRSVGESMPCSLRETAEGGLATTPTGNQIKKKLKHY